MSFQILYSSSAYNSLESVFQPKNDFFTKNRVKTALRVGAAICFLTNEKVTKKYVLRFTQVYIHASPSQGMFGLPGSIFFCFFYKVPYFIAFERCESEGLYEALIHLCCMLSHILQQSTYSVSVVTGYPLDTPYTVLLYQMFANIDYFTFG